MSQYHEVTEKLMIENEEGEAVELDILFTFDNEETKKSYIIYTDGTLDEQGMTRVYASIYDSNTSFKNLQPIESEEEWKIIEIVLEEIQKEVISSKEKENLVEIDENNALNKNLKTINNLMKHAKPNADLCLIVYQIISAAEEENQVALFKHFVSNIKDIESDNKLEIPSIIESEDLEKHSEHTINVLAKKVRSLYEKQSTEQMFYEKLWGFIQKDTVFLNEIDRAVAIFNSLKFLNVPYVKFDFSKALFLKEGEFEIYLSKVKKSKEYNNINSICKHVFAKKTEKYSLLLNELESCNDFKERVLLFLLIASELEKYAYLEGYRKGVESIEEE